MKRSLLGLLIVALVAGALVAPADAKKKRKKKAPPPVSLTASESKYFLHWDPDGATGCGDTYMNLVDQEGDSTCNLTFQPLQEAFVATGAQPVLSTVYPAQDGLPLILDASRKLTGEVVLRGTFTVDGSVELVLTGTVNGAEVEIAKGQTGSGDGVASSSVQGQELPGPPVILPVEIEINKAYDKLQVTALTLTATIRGYHRGGIDYERNPSHIIIPTFI